MVDRQEHFGRRFYQDKKTGYWISTDRPRVRAHRWVWISTHGLIPKGYHIHHKDENKSNNCIENLELIERSRHMSHHYSEEKKQWSREWADKIRPLTKDWHASEEGKAWHRLHAIKCKFGNWEPIKYTCQCCDKKYESKKKSRARFCSNKCKSKWRRDQGIDDIAKICLNCGVGFKSNKYSKALYCSKSCTMKDRIIR